MAKVKDILIHVTVETAARRRKCHRSSKHSISAGNVCVVIKDGLSHRNYCAVCAGDILMLATQRLAEIRSLMGL